MSLATQAMARGATLTRAGAEFRVSAPKAQSVELLLWEIRASRPDPHHQEPQRIAMRREAEGTFAASAAARAGDLYQYSVDGQEPVPDPVSRLLPEGVHGRTAIVDPDAFVWTDSAWHGRRLRDYVLYEL